MKRFSALLLCLLLAATFCACTSSSPAASSETPVTSLPASSAEAPSSALPASSEAAEKLELEIDQMIDFDTISYGEYITKDGTLVTDEACARRRWETSDRSIAVDDYGKYLHERFGVTKNISTAVLNWNGVISEGKLCGMHLESVPSGNEAAYDQLKKEAAAILASWTNVLAVPSVAAREICYPWAYSTDTCFSIDTSGSKLASKSTPLSAEEAGAVVIDGILWLKPDGTLYCTDERFDFSAYSSIVSAYPALITADPAGYYLLRADGTLCFADIKGKCEVLKENIAQMRDGRLFLSASNEVFLCTEEHTDNGNAFSFESIGSVSDWRSVAYMKDFGNNLVIAAMKNGTVEIVSPGDTQQYPAEKPLLDFFASIKDLKVQR